MRRPLLLLALLSACSSPKAQSAPTAARATLALLDAFPGISTRTFARPGFAVSLPTRGGEGMRVGVDDSIYLELAAERDAPVAAVPVDGTLLFPSAQPDVDVVIATTRERVEELRLLRSARAANTLRYRVHLGPGVRDLRVRDGFVELLDREGTARLRSDRWFAVDSKHRRIEIAPRVTGEGSERVLEGVVDTAGATYPIAVDPGWGPPATMAYPRMDHTAVPLKSGKVLVIGGEGNGSSVLSAVEIFDPTTRTWTLAKSMTGARRLHASVALASGNVFVVGGAYSSSVGAHSTAEIYDPTTDTWTAAGAMAEARIDVCAALLQPSGKIVVAGGVADGISSTGYFTTAELWNPSTLTFSTTTNGATAGHVHAFAEGIGNDKAIVIGGNAGYSTADVYDAAVNRFASPAIMNVAREDHAVVRLASGSILVIGGYDALTAAALNSTAESFDPSGGAFAAIAAMPGRRRYPHAVRLASGKVLVAGGFSDDTGSPEEKGAFLYDPTANTWSSAGSTGTQRIHGAMAPLPDGGAILTGGKLGTSTTPTSSVELYGDALIAGAACTAGTQCVSGFCADGVCCDRACTGNCEACNETGSVGTCKLVTGVPRGTRPACVTDGACSGACSGAAASCTYPSSSTVCIASTCIGGVVTGAGYCNGAGNCGGTPTPVDCAPFNCGATSCKTTCAADTDCVASAYCDAGSCKVKKKQGDACSGATSCATGFCVDGVCCDTACTDDCRACNVPASEGVCSAAACGDAGVVTDSATPDVGAIADAPAPNPGDKPSVTGSYQKCSKNSECPTGFCVEGVCCDTACKERCHSCALLASPGKCTLEPTGVDLKNECGAALSCVGTCGPGGECVGAGNGTMCARNRCTGPTSGVGPAYCPSPGGTCGVDQAVAFDCAPYLCEPAFGACSNSCTSSDDCARGFVCDVPSKTCVPAPTPAPEEDSGCAMSPRASSSSVGALTLLALLVLQKRRSPRRARRPSSVSDR